VSAARASSCRSGRRRRRSSRCRPAPALGRSCVRLTAERCRVWRDCCLSARWSSLRQHNGQSGPSAGKRRPRSSRRWRAFSRCLPRKHANRNGAASTENASQIVACRRRASQPLSAQFSSYCFVYAVRTTIASLWQYVFPQLSCKKVGKHPYTRVVATMGVAKDPKLRAMFRRHIKCPDQRFVALAQIAGKTREAEAFADRALSPASA